MNLFQPDRQTIRVMKPSLIDIENFLEQGHFVRRFTPAFNVPNAIFYLHNKYSIRNCFLAGTLTLVPRMFSPTW